MVHVPCQMVQKSLMACDIARWCLRPGRPYTWGCSQKPPQGQKRKEVLAAQKQGCQEEKNWKLKGGIKSLPLEIIPNTSATDRSYCFWQSKLIIWTPEYHYQGIFPIKSTTTKTFLKHFKTQFSKSSIIFFTHSKKQKCNKRWKL